MQIRIGRLIIASLAIEALAILVLILLVALFGPKENSAAQVYGERLGYWVGPIAGFILCLVGGYWVARGTSPLQIFNGLLLGIIVAGIDLGLLVVGGVTFQIIFVISNIGRILGGGVGGWLALRSMRDRRIG